MLLNSLQCTGESPLERIIQSKMSVVLPLINSGLDDNQRV